MVKDNGNDFILAKHNIDNGNTVVMGRKMWVVIAGGIRLRVMSKGVKFANSSDADVSAAVKGASVSSLCG
ncbi:Variable outer membrane protein [Borrelia duttonii CR2A]|uniref:Variable large protein n=1 Tax=Borrelia duttonii CR2A TaxID=1432657 RepID=W6TFP0_9SPIR|nr:Variable outer membrane protein [Borrelia duttonii CR2A]